MGKSSPALVLKTIFKDISNIGNIIRDSKEIEQTCDQVNFEDNKEVEKLIEDTKIIVTSLKADVTKIDDYFNENYNSWKNELNTPLSEADPTTNDNDSRTNAVANEKDLQEDKQIEESTIEKAANSEETEENNMKKSKHNKSQSKEIVDTEKDSSTTQAGTNSIEENSKNNKSNKESEKDLNVENTNNIEKKFKNDEAQSKQDTAVSKPKKIEKKSKRGNSQSKEGKEVTDNEKDFDTNSTTAQENTDKTDDNTGTASTESDATVKTEDAPETKVFLKCVDISKLINPDLPPIKSPPPTRSRNNLNDSVLIISDSDQEDTVAKKQNNKETFRSKRNVTKPKKEPLVNTTDKNLSLAQSLAMKGITVTMSKPSTRNRKSLDSDIAIISDSNSDSKENKNKPLKKDSRPTKKVDESFSSDTDSKSSVKKKSDQDKNKINKKRGRRNKDPLNKKNLSDTSSMSDSETTSKPHKSDDGNSQKSRRSVAKHKLSKKEKFVLDTQSDKKFSYEAYVSLPHIACEKLKEYYQNYKEIDEVKRLTDLNNLKRRRADQTTEKKDHASSSDTENVKPKPKRKRKTSKNSHTSDGNRSDEAPAPEVLKELNAEMTESEPKEDSTNKEMDRDTVKMILDGINSATDASGHESEADDEDEGEEKNQSKKGESDKKSKKSAKNDDAKKEKDESKNDKDKKDASEASSSDKEKKKEKSKWRGDELLTSKISDSDSEDEFIKFKKRSESVRQDLKSRGCRKKAKKVIVSDSDTENEDESKKKDSSGDEFKPTEKKSSSSESEQEKSEVEKEDEQDSEKKKRRRIKRVKDSSSDEENKSTRKIIRRVITHDSLAEATKQAEKDEKERKARISERQKKYNQIYDSDKPEDATVDKVVLDFNEETKEEIIAVNEELVKQLKPHQAKGVQFMWDACYESVARTKKTAGSGCILAHCMGLGKTLQVITLVHTLIMNQEETGVQRVLVVCPLNTVLNWVSEFGKWLDDIDGEEIDVYDLVSCKQIRERKYQVEDWIKRGGVLVIGYDMFRNLTNPTNKRLKKSEREIFHRGLVNPGPDLVVCDEGHLLKNEKTNLSIAMNRIRTIRRIVLTGTPMQNNLKEYYCMVQFVKPNLLGTYKEYLNRFVNPITNGQYTDSTQHDINVMRKRAHVLHKMLDGIVQRKDYSVLTPYLPPKFEYVLFLTLTEVQIKLYRHYLEEESRRPDADTKMRTTFLFKDFQEFQRICTHPRVLLLKSQEIINKKDMLSDEDEDSEGSLKDFIDDKESDDASSTNSGSSSDSSLSGVSVKSKEAKKKKPGQRVTRNTAATLGIDVVQETEEAVVSNEWWNQYCSGDELNNIALSSKMFLLFEILQQCELIGDKLLVFSQSLYSLNIIEYFLARIDEATQKGENESVSGFSGSWALGLDYFRLDGSSSCDNRSAWCKSFNSPSNTRARLFLISTKAGGLGINLVGANRVIIFDVSWNPSHDVQSIYRIYRFGQTKPCYIYRFVTNGTMEMKIYERQVTKQAISKRVIDEQQIDRHYNQTDLAELYNFDPKPDEQPIPLVPKDVLLAEMLQKEKDRIFKYHEHQSLLENKEDEELDEAERKAAWEEFENEKTARVAANTTGGWIKNLPITSITAAVVNIVQKDNPTWSREQVQSVVPLIVEQLREQVDKGEMLLFNRIVNELKLMQASQQQRLQEYYMQQQLRMLQQRYAQQQQRNAGPGVGFDFGNALRTALSNQSAPTQSNDIVELND